MTTETMHIGKKISRIRELKGMKQETLAAAMGVTQQAISKLEQSEHVEDDRLEEVGKALGVTVDAIKNFNDENIIFHIQNMHESAAYAQNYNNNCTINPIEKIIELYERMLKLEREKIELMEKMLQKK
jgi:transcriptional regulator with XRE-family HTH domain